MDPTVTAAAIGVAGTVLVGVAGFGAAVWNTRRTIAHARESRIWDRRVEVYAEALTAVKYRQLTREVMLNPGDKRLKAILAIYEQPDWSGLEGRLRAFASEPVLTAIDASTDAHMRVVGGAEVLYGFFGGMPKQDQESSEKKAADAADKAAVEVIRGELHGGKEHLSPERVSRWKFLNRRQKQIQDHE